MKRPSNGPGSTTGGRSGAALWWAAALLLFPVTEGCAPETTPPPKKSDAKIPEQVIDGVKMRETSQRGLLWILDAHQGLSYGADQPTQLKILRVRFFDGQEQVRSTLTSKRGEVNEDTQLLSAQDSVVVVTPKGERLETESLLWDPHRERIRTDAPFRLTRGQDVMTGVGFDADPDLTHYSVHSSVHAVMRDEKNDEIMHALDTGPAAGSREPHADSTGNRQLHADSTGR